MKAIVYSSYGSPDVLRLEELDMPPVGDGDVLIKVRAAAVNPLDWHFMRGSPYLLRLAGGLRKPKDRRLGVDVAGQVEAVGKNITQLKAGDDVFGSCRGAFAEYACTSERALVLKPESVTFEQAASVCVGALTALQGLRDHGHIQSGQKVLINCASGGVGTYAVQIAKRFGADVTGVCSTRNLDLVRSIGADSVIDYTQEDFTTTAHRYDLILDCIGNHSLRAYKRVLNPTGMYVGVGGPTGNWMLGTLAVVIFQLVASRFASQKAVVVLMKPNKEDLTFMQGLLASGKVQPVIDRSYSLRDVPDAISYLEEGHARGKVVITVG